MIIYPAIDIKNGKCVRLYQGDFAKETIYADNPLIVAQQYRNAGATWLHIIDLDGAKNPASSQLLTLVNDLTVNASLQVGGGIRSQMQLAILFNGGVSRIIIGSLAVTHREVVKSWIKYFGADKICLAFDVFFDGTNEPVVAIHGWEQKCKQSLYELMDFYQTVKIKHILCTSILRDGTLNGPDFYLYQMLLEKYPSLLMQASGGIRSLDDLRMLKNEGLAGAVVGRALYEKSISLTEALVC